MAKNTDTPLVLSDSMTVKSSLGSRKTGRTFPITGLASLGASRSEDRLIIDISTSRRLEHGRRVQTGSLFVDKRLSSDYAYDGVDPITVAEDTVIPLVISDLFTFWGDKQINFWLPQHRGFEYSCRSGFPRCFYARNWHLKYS